MVIGPNNGINKPSEKGPIVMKIAVPNLDAIGSDLAAPDLKLELLNGPLLFFFFIFIYTTNTTTMNEEPTKCNYSGAAAAIPLSMSPASPLSSSLHFDNFHDYQVTRPRRPSGDAARRVVAPCEYAE